MFLSGRVAVTHLPGSEMHAPKHCATVFVKFLGFPPHPL